MTFPPLHRVSGPSVPLSILEKLPVTLEGTFQKLSSPDTSPRKELSFAPTPFVEPAAHSELPPSVPTSAREAEVGFVCAPSLAALPSPHVDTTPELRPTPPDPNLTAYLQVERDVPVHLECMLTSPQPQWYVINGQPTLALVQDVVRVPDILEQALQLAGIPPQPLSGQPSLVQPEPLPREDDDTHQIAAERILRYLQDHEPPIPGQADQTGRQDQSSEEDSDVTQENDSKRQALRSAGPPTHQ